MRIVGIDPGSRFVGYGILDLHRGRIHLAGHGVIRATPQGPLAERLLEVFEELNRVFKIYAPEAMAVEGVFSHRNARSALVLGHARGVALLTGALAQIPVYEYAPAKVKKSVGAGGNDGKDAVARMVTTLLNLTKPLERADAYDALAVALCHAHHHKSNLRPLTKSAMGNETEAFLGRLKPNVVRVES